MVVRFTDIMLKFYVVATESHSLTPGVTLSNSKEAAQEGIFKVDLNNYNSFFLT